MSEANVEDVAEIEVSKGLDDDVEVEARTKVLSKRIFHGPIAFVEKSASLDRSREYGNKAHIGVKITLPCYPDEVYDALDCIGSILEDEMVKAMSSVKSSVSNLVDKTADVSIRTKRGEKRKAEKK